ncbi:MAG TPA: hypothetical protein VF064_07095, partial [Pyrinomonadaceae bacterium]
MRLLIRLFVVLIVICETAPAQSAWPRPVPARVKDGENRDLFVMTLGDVETTLADGTFDPLRDEVRLKDGTVKPNYYKEALRVKYFRPMDKSRFA